MRGLVLAVASKPKISVCMIPLSGRANVSQRASAAGGARTGPRPSVAFSLPLRIYLPPKQLDLFNRNMAKSISTDDYERVIAAAQTYADGVRVGSASTVATAFHKNATMFGVGEKVFDGSIDALYTFIDAHGQAPKMKSHLDVLAITPTTAVVRVELEQDVLGLDYTDFLTLLKVNGKWSIVAKVFHAYEAKN